MNINEIIPYTKKAQKPLQTMEDLKEATSLLSTLNKYMDELTEDKEKLTKPLNASLKAIREKYKPREDLLNSAISQLRQNLNAYATLEAKRIKEEEERILLDGRTKTETKIQQLAEIAPTTDKVTTEEGSVTFVTVTKYHLTDPAKVPVELLEINTTALKDYLKKGNALPKGITVTEEQSLRNYRK